MPFAKRTSVLPTKHELIVVVVVEVVVDVVVVVEVEVKVVDVVEVVDDVKVVVEVDVLVDVEVEVVEEITTREVLTASLPISSVSVAGLEEEGLKFIQISPSKRVPIGTPFK